MGRFGLLVLLSVTLGYSQDISQLSDPAQLVGKKVMVGRLMLCHPNTFNADAAHSGLPAIVVSAKPGPRYSFDSRVLAKMPLQARATLEDQAKASVLLFRFDDGSELDTCAPIGPKKLAEGLKLQPGEEITGAASAKAEVSAPSQANQECPVIVTKVSSTDGGFGHGLADAMTTSEFERQVDRSTHGGQNKHYLDMRMKNTSTQPIAAFESVVLYLNAMGDEGGRDTLISQNKKPIKPGDDYKAYFMDRGETAGQGSVKLYISRVRFEDGTFWKDNGSGSCSLEGKSRQ